MPQELEDRKTRQLDNLDDDRQAGEEGEDRLDIKQWSLELLFKHIRTILSTVVILLLFVAFIVSNTVTGTVCTLLATSIVEKKYRKLEGITAASKFTGPMYVIGESDYSLKSNDNEPVYLRMNIIFELDERKVIDEVRENDARIKSIIREIVTNKDIGEFSARTGMQHARRLMLESVNKILTGGKITNIYFIDYRFIWVDDTTE